eukprot:GABW01004770.1.p3 GENE.GABW01004770.1~~GABW01004770.1.p3  ORF type:complete len:50 (+),score=4.94 GABW01004770.1:164-313(+)
MVHRYSHLTLIYHSIISKLYPSITIRGGVRGDVFVKNDVKNDVNSDVKG